MRARLNDVDENERETMPEKNKYIYFLNEYVNKPAYDIIHDRELRGKVGIKKSIIDDVMIKYVNVSALAGKSEKQAVDEKKHQNEEMKLSLSNLNHMMSKNSSSIFVCGGHNEV